ncbi:hypothetical protein [Megamonas funiformis]|uniref:hypothetical protein n=1 Tax=Megamonas funiformis TaxID=437897 RepID=UPI00265D2B4F|nr:hypothetical protein [Megamonas funiformis]
MAISDITLNIKQNDKVYTCTCYDNIEEATPTNGSCLEIKKNNSIAYVGLQIEGKTNYDTPLHVKKDNIIYVIQSKVENNSSYYYENSNYMFKDVNENYVTYITAKDNNYLGNGIHYDFNVSSDANSSVIIPIVSIVPKNSQNKETLDFGASKIIDIDNQKFLGTGFIQDTKQLIDWSNCDETHIAYAIALSDSVYDDNEAIDKYISFSNKNPGYAPYNTNLVFKYPIKDENGVTVMPNTWSILTNIKSLYTITHFSSGMWDGNPYTTLTYPYNSGSFILYIQIAEGLKDFISNEEFSGKIQQIDNRSDFTYQIDSIQDSSNQINLMFNINKQFNITTSREQIVSFNMLISNTYGYNTLLPLNILIKLTPVYFYFSNIVYNNYHYTIENDNSLKKIPFEVTCSTDILDDIDPNLLKLEFSSTLETITVVYLDEVKWNKINKKFSGYLVIDLRNTNSSQFDLTTRFNLAIDIADINESTQDSILYFVHKAIGKYWSLPNWINLVSPKDNNDPIIRYYQIEGNSSDIIIVEPIQDSIGEDQEMVFTLGTYDFYSRYVFETSSYLSIDTIKIDGTLGFAINEFNINNILNLNYQSNGQEIIGIRMWLEIYDISNNKVISVYSTLYKQTVSYTELDENNASIMYVKLDNLTFDKYNFTIIENGAIADSQNYHMKLKLSLSAKLNESNPYTYKKCVLYPNVFKIYVTVSPQNN